MPPPWSPTIALVRVQALLKHPQAEANPSLSRSSDSKYSHHFQATSPVSVLESAGSSCSTENATAYYPKFVAPVRRPRSKQQPRRRTFPFNPHACASKKFYRLHSSDNQNYRT
uniref:Uncharacterized protein n=1 Tax=Salix viminalis TaxID=40686 RepID=A0A6N2NCD8_SALVM